MGNLEISQVFNDQSNFPFRGQAGAYTTIGFFTKLSASHKYSAIKL